jgi:hypothetical protein
MHMIYLLQADVETEVCCGSSGQVYKGFLSSLLHVLGLHQPVVGLSLLAVVCACRLACWCPSLPVVGYLCLAVTVCACRWPVGVFPACRGFISAAVEVSCMLLIPPCWFVGFALMVCWCRPCGLLCCLAHSVSRFGIYAL